MNSKKKLKPFSYSKKIKEIIVKMEISTKELRSTQKKRFIETKQRFLITLNKYFKIRRAKWKKLIRGKRESL